MSTTPEPKRVMPVGGRPAGARSLTTKQKAEAVAAWREGSTTLEELGKKFKKRPETFSRLFKRMGVEKGSGAAAALKRAEEAAAERMVSDVEETLKRIAQVKDSHFKMSQAIAIMAFREVQRAKAAELDVARLKDAMTTYKLLSDIVGNSRKELFEILNVVKHDANSEHDDLPDLTVRELTQNEVETLRSASSDDGLDGDMGTEMLDLDDDDVGAGL